MRIEKGIFGDYGIITNREYEKLNKANRKNYVPDKYDKYKAVREAIYCGECGHRTGISTARVPTRSAKVIRWRQANLVDKALELRREQIRANMAYANGIFSREKMEI